MLYFENRKIDVLSKIRCLGDSGIYNFGAVIAYPDIKEKYNELYLFSSSFLHASKELLKYCDTHWGEYPLFENVITISNSGKIDYKRYYYPYIVCYLAYHALELYLKACLLQFSIKPAKKHDLVALWNELKTLCFKKDNDTDDIIVFIDKILYTFKTFTQNGFPFRYPFENLEKNVSDYFEIDGLDPYKMYYYVLIIIIQLQELKSDEFDRKIPDLFDKSLFDPLINLKQQEEQHENNPI